MPSKRKSSLFLKRTIMLPISFPHQAPNQISIFLMCSSQQSLWFISICEYLWLDLECWTPKSWTLMPRMSSLTPSLIVRDITPPPPLWFNSTTASKQPCEEPLSFFFPIYFFISWRLITLQYCSGFCHTLTWINHGFTCIPHPDPPSHLPLYPIPLGLPGAPGQSTCLMHPTWAGGLFHYR